MCSLCVQNGTVCATNVEVDPENLVTRVRSACVNLYLDSVQESVLLRKRFLSIHVNTVSECCSDCCCCCREEEAAGGGGQSGHRAASRADAGPCCPAPADRSRPPLLIAW